VCEIAAPTTTFADWVGSLQYHHWLIALSIFFIVAERLVSWRKQSLFRKGWVKDFLYLVLNGHYLAFVLIGLTDPAAKAFHRLLASLGVESIESVAILHPLGPVLQFLIVLVVIDFIKWLVHNALHRVPFLWKFHQIHHTIQELDWVGTMRFHWMEVIFYKAAIYLPMAILGARGDVLLTYYVVETFLGFLSHSNLNVTFGPLRYLFNNPRMHVWHHEYTKDGRMNLNFGIVLSVWDYLFGTANVPALMPDQLGFQGMERVPESLVGQMLYPLVKGRAP
jgi:sterol desaturase/sphingolipid hydroxylase (fatty acid hydroxylase superfamily)